MGNSAQRTAPPVSLLLTIMPYFILFFPVIPAHQGFPDEHPRVLETATGRKASGEAGKYPVQENRPSASGRVEAEQAAAA